MTITKDVLSSGTANAGFPQQAAIKGWIEVQDQYGNSLSPEIYACSECGTVSMTLREDAERCRVCGMRS